MQLLISVDELNNLKGNTKNVPCRCYQCSSVFYIIKTEAKRALKGRPINKYCSVSCFGKSLITKELVNCLNCRKDFYKRKNQIKKHPNNFCNHSCAASYNNTHKKYGIRRSKLEMYIEKELSVLYLDLEIHYNKKTTIGSELDIYIPLLKMAIEINGPTHYFPIFGEETYNSILKNDQKKKDKCIQHDIDLYSIDVSRFSHFKEDHARVYLNSIIDLIKSKCKVVEPIGI